MKRSLLLSLLFACHAPASSSPAPAAPAQVAAPAPADASTCPAAGETAEDCPWADVGRARDPHAALARVAPGVLAQLDRDAKAPATLTVWGAALNHNQLAGGKLSDEPIVALAIIDELTARAGAAPRRDRVVHAGVQHTYGYLFSILSTPFGFKRARWVQPTLDDGFGLPRNTLSPTPAAGTLLGNVTWLAGAIAFAGEPELAAAHSAPANAAPALQALDVAKLQRKRLTETVEVNGRTVVLRTDFVELPHPTATTSTLLIYSIRDGSASRLITAFPISASARDKYAGAPLGDNQPITTQYNAWIDGLTGTKLPGRRTLQ